MFCTLCKKNEQRCMQLLGIDICKKCMEEISTVPVFLEEYDYYKELIKVILKNYMCERAELNSVN